MDIITTSKLIVEVRDCGHLLNQAGGLTRKLLAGISNWAVALAVVLLAAFTGPSSPNVGLSDASGSHASAFAGPAKPACGSDEVVIYQRNLSSPRPLCDAASRTVPTPSYTMPSSVDVGFSDAPESDSSAAAAPPTAARGSNELVAYQPNPSLGSEQTSEPASKTAASPGYAMPSTSDFGFFDASRSNPSAPAAPSTPTCGSNEVRVYHPNLPEPACAAVLRTAAEIAKARAYLIETASPGYTMTLQGPGLAIGRLHPEFSVRLESAIREARSAGLPFAGVFSAYRPPAFGVGGFSDKFNSLHTYGLAVDMRGIGNPGSPEAQLWHQIAAKNGVVCPYGPRARTEWNHCQPTSVRIIWAENPLRDTVSSAGPFDLETMFEAGNSLIEDKASAADSLSRAVAPPPVRTLEDLKPPPLIVASRRTKRNSREADKSARHAKLAQRDSVKVTPIIAVEERRVGAKSARHAKLAQRDSVKVTPIIAAEERRVGAKSVRHAKVALRGSAKGTSIIAVEERRVGAKSVRHAKVALRGSAKGTPIIAVEERRVGAKSVRHAKLALRGRVKGIPIIAVEEGRRKSKSGRA
jgi:hypothetical protein